MVGGVLVGGVVVFGLMARFIKVMLQLLLGVPSALSDGAHLLRGRSCMRVLVRTMIMRVLFVFIAHTGIVPPDTLAGKTGDSLWP